MCLQYVVTCSRKVLLEATSDVKSNIFGVRLILEYRRGAMSPFNLRDRDTSNGNDKGSSTYSYSMK